MDILDPPPNWKFTHLLSRFCSELSSNDLVEIKVLFKGIVSEDVKTWAEMADILLNKGFLTQYNIVYLQKIVHHLNRPDLLHLTIEYAKESEHEVLHFEEHKTMLVSGHEHIRIHIKGHRCQTHDEMNKIRRTISEILFVDIKDVMFVGVQEANSVLVTFMLPTMYVEVFKKVLESEKKNRFMAPLTLLGVDLIYIDEVTYKIDTEDQCEPIDDKKENILQLQRQVEQKDQQLKKMETELLLLKRNQRKALSSDDQSNEPQGTEKKRKILPDFTYKDPKLNRMYPYDHILPQNK